RDPIRRRRRRAVRRLHALPRPALSAVVAAGAPPYPPPGGPVPPRGARPRPDTTGGGPSRAPRKGPPPPPRPRRVEWADGAEGRDGAFMEVFTAADRHLLMAQNVDKFDDCIMRAFKDTAAEDPLRRLMDVDLATQMPEDLLMLTDKMSMAVSLECRVPLLDQR